MAKYVYEKVNGVTTKRDVTLEFEEKIKSEKTHKCWENCENASVLCCPKIAHDVKELISNYDFITDGYQIFDENDKLISFRVLECLNYKKVKPVKLDNEQERKLELIRNDLKKALKESGKHTGVQEGKITDVKSENLMRFLNTVLKDSVKKENVGNLFTATDDNVELVRSNINKNMKFYTDKDEYFESNELMKANIFIMAVDSILEEMGFAMIDSITVDKVDEFLTKLNNYIENYTNKEISFDSTMEVQFMYNKYKNEVDENNRKSK